MPWDLWSALGVTHVRDRHGMQEATRRCWSWERSCLRKPYSTLWRSEDLGFSNTCWISLPGYPMHILVHSKLNHCLLSRAQITFPFYTLPPLVNPDRERRLNPFLTYQPPHKEGITIFCCVIQIKMSTQVAPFFLFPFPYHLTVQQWSSSHLVSWY